MPGTGCRLADASACRCDAFLSRLERRVFPGGCFFVAAAAEFDTHDGRVKERIRLFGGPNALERAATGIRQRLGLISSA